MKEHVIPQEEIGERFRSIAGSKNVDAVARKRSIRDLADTHGIDLSNVRDQYDQVDIMTGKRVTIE